MQRPHSWQLVYLVDVGMPHFGEEAEGWWGVRVVDRKRNVSLRCRELQRTGLTFSLIFFLCAAKVGPSMSAPPFFDVFKFFDYNFKISDHLLATLTQNAQRIFTIVCSTFITK